MVIVEWTTIPGKQRILTTSFSLEDAQTRADILAAIDGAPVPSVALVGCRVKDEERAKPLAARRQVQRKPRRRRNYCNDLLMEYFVGISTYRCPLALTPRGSSTPPSVRLMLYCEMGGIIAALPAKLRRALVNRWDAWLLYQHARVSRMECRHDLRAQYRKLSKRVAYRKATDAVTEAIMRRGIDKK